MQNILAKQNGVFKGKVVRERVESSGKGMPLCIVRTHENRRYIKVKWRERDCVQVTKGKGIISPTQDLAIYPKGYEKTV